MRGKSRLLSVVVTCLMLAAIALPSACSQAPAPAPTSQPASAPAPAPTSQAPAAAPAPTSAPAAAAAPAPGKTINLVYEVWLPANAADMPPIQAFFKGLEDATGGTVKTQFMTDGVMGNAADTYQRTLNRVNDVGHFTPGYTPDVFPMFDVFTMPLRFPNAETLERAVLQLQEKGYFDKEFSNVKVLVAKTNDSAPLFLTKKKATKIDDFKGLKLRTSSEGWTAVANALGATPVTVPTSDMYVMMQKGTLDGSWVAWSGVRSYKLNEVSKYANAAPWMTNTHIIAMNKDTWNALPQAGKDYIDKNKQALALADAKAQDDAAAPMKQLFTSTGGEIINFDAGEFDKTDQLFAPIWQKWIADREAKGLPVKNMLKDLSQIMTGLGIQKPLIGYTP